MKIGRREAGGGRREEGRGADRFPRVILAAHGSRRGGEANRIVRRHARKLREEFGFGSVTAAFWQGRPSFAEVLDRSEAARSVVVPFFSADGYYAGTVLPRELSRNRTFDAARLRLTKPLGMRPEMEQLAAQRARILLARWKWAARRTALLLVGHGTRRNPRSRLSTIQLASRLGQLGLCARVEAAFLDEPPLIEEALRRVEERNVLLLPFLIGGSCHSLQDIPRRAGLTASGIPPLPFTAAVGLRRVGCDRALGSDPSMPWVISRMVREEMGSGSHAKAQSRKGMERDGLWTSGLGVFAALRETPRSGAEDLRE